jgi:DNA polymerase-3 subunit beta
MKMSLENGKVVLSVSNTDSGTATEEMEVEYTGEALDVGFNSRYVSDILGQVEGDKVTLKLNDPGSPALVTGGDEGSLFVLMPMRV